MIHYFEIVDSTNTIAFRMANQGAGHGTIIHAGRQTGGKGRGGREFLSPEGGLYFSLIIKPDLDPFYLPLVSLAAGVGICDSLLQVAGVQAKLKWPNDLYLNDRKLAGILTESGPICGANGPDFLVIGVGMNVKTDVEQFPSFLRTKVISLYDSTECAGVDVDSLLNTFVDAMLYSVQRVSDDRDKLLADWRSLDYLQGRMLQYVGNEGLTTATGIGLASDGRYVIRDRSGVKQYIVAGDINPIMLTSL